MKRIPIDQLRAIGGNVWHAAFAAGRMVDGVAVEVADDFPLEPAPTPAIPPQTHPFGNLRLLTPAEQSARLAACQACEKNVAGNCTLCQTCGGRPVTAKVRLSSETCPLHRWPDLNPV